MPTFRLGFEDEEEPGANEEEEGEGADGANARTKPSGIGRVLNDGKPLACGHCEGELGHGGIEGELRSVDVSSQGVGTGGLGNMSQYLACSCCSLGVVR